MLFFREEVFKLKNQISVSILSADICELGKSVRELEKAKTDMLHFDVMDGVFVNNISFGIPVLESINKFSEMFMDVHLMIINPLKYVESFAKAGADMITFHAEAESDISETIDKIHSFGIKAGLAVSPATPIETVYPYLDKLDMVLVMTVVPGFGGQKFMTEVLEKVRDLRKHLENTEKKEMDIQVDGGINGETVKLAKEAGANVFVSGSYVFKNGDISETIRQLKD